MSDEGDETPTVLLVDDEESVLDTYTLYLESEGYEVRLARNGGEALVELDPAVDVVLLDRRMPGMTGDEVLEHIRNWSEHVRVAMITAVDPAPDIVELDFDDYLTKPISKDDLLDSVEQLLLLDEYERLLTEYHALTRKYATLHSFTEAVDAEGEAELERLEGRRRELKAEIGKTLDGFTDDRVADVFEAVHAGRE